MSDSPKISRRDWFRLSTPSRDSLVGDGREWQVSTGEEKGHLKSIEHPPNHDGMNLNELPPLREAILADADVAALFGDIQAHGTDVQLMQKRGANNTHAHARRDSSLQIARQLYLSGEVNRLQIRYRWNSMLWIDTLVRQDDDGATRLVRVSHPT